MLLNYCCLFSKISKLFFHFTTKMNTLCLILLALFAVKKVLQNLTGDNRMRMQLIRGSLVTKFISRIPFVVVLTVSRLNHRSLLTFTKHANRLIPNLLLIAQNALVKLATSQLAVIHVYLYLKSRVYCLLNLSILPEYAFFVVTIKLFI